MSNKADSPQTPEKGRISALQFALLNTTLIIATADVFLPAFVAQEAKQDSWIAVIIGTVTAGVIINILITLGLKYPDKTLTEYSCDILGKPLGRVIGML
ncbi:MAG: GerAB/ArcD/ProY family transporter, partial [Caulobacteraceae bacterium]